MEERQIGTTELRQRLTDVIQAVKEEKVAYVVETFGRPQVVIISLEVYRRLKDATQAHLINANNAPEDSNNTKH